MAVTPTPVFTQGVQSSQCVCTAAKTTYNDSTNAVLLMTAGINGAVVYAIRALPRATVTATQLQIYRSPDAGVTYNLADTATMSAYTFANTTSPTKTDFGYTESIPLRLASNERLYAGIAVALAGGVVFDAQYENL
jgi:hypothetical protein